MPSPISIRKAIIAGLIPLLLVILVTTSGCKRHGGRTGEVAYVSAPMVPLRDRVATVFNKVGTAKNAERVEVLERTNNRRFVRVRTSNGVEGWIEQRSLVDQKVFDGFQKLVQENQNSPAQATAVTHSESNLHVTPGRDTEHLYQLPQGEKIILLKRSTAEKVAPGGASPRSAKQKKPAGSMASAVAAPTVLEDWWLVRDSQNHVGWLLGRLVDLDIPLEIAQYSEGQHLVAFFVLNEVSDRTEANQEKKVPQYLVLFTDTKEGQLYDYNQIRVFTWNVKRHRYETAYREHKLFGVLPVTQGHQDFGKEGNLPVFTLHVRDEAAKDDTGKDDATKIVERKYKLNTPMVRRVFAAGEEAASAHKKN